MQEWDQHLTALAPGTASWSGSPTIQSLATCVTSPDPLLLPQPIPAESQTAPTTTWSSGRCVFAESDKTQAFYMHSHTLCLFLNLSRLGHKLQGVLCDGDSNEVVASTVVNCLRIDEGKMLKHFNNFLVCFFIYSLSNTDVSYSFCRNDHHCEGGLCPCSKSQADLWESEKKHGVKRPFEPGYQEDCLQPMFFIQQSEKNT